ncbi:probable cytochrome P450 4d14 [Vespa mandarinia]|uniref:probable cytochrome P450 4d14 n=1 Tax=Vespa mandarinia TaxID=7446 RepID=UPI00161CF46F|nr:probable cytochrome P450 4d14 [Vespa mandarinia]
MESMLRSKINRELSKKKFKKQALSWTFYINHPMKEEYLKQDIRNEINTIAIAISRIYYLVAIKGSEISTTVINFVLLMLAKFKWLIFKYDKVYEKLNQIYGFSDPRHVPLTYDIKNINLLKRMIKETLRLFPADSAIARKITQNRKLDYIERFLPGKNSSTYFFPFSYGRRNCVGQNFTMLEMIMIIATLIRRFLIKIDNSIGIVEIGLKMSITLKLDWTNKIKI